MGNSNRDDFERMMQLAEFGAKRHDERRQVDFRVFIAYMTLLALTFYQIDKIKVLNLPTSVILLGLGLIHFTYILWEIRVSRSQSNDASRRNFYLKKAECILDHLRKHPNVPFQPRKDVSITIDLGAKVDKIYEYELFAKHEPNVVLVSPMWKFWKHWEQIREDWSRPFPIFIPTATLGLIILTLLRK